jgi:hypothetical protein
MEKVAENIHGYKYGTSEIAVSRISIRDLEEFKISVGFTPEDELQLRLGGEVLAQQAKRIVEHWRSGIIAGIPNLSRHSRSPEGEALPDYAAKSNLRFEQWIMDTSLRPYDQDWLNTKRRLRCVTPVSRKTRWIMFNQLPTCHCATSSHSLRS